MAAPAIVMNAVFVGDAAAALVDTDLLCSFKDCDLFLWQKWDEFDSRAFCALSPLSVHCFKKILH